MGGTHVNGRSKEHNAAIAYGKADHTNVTLNKLKLDRKCDLLLVGYDRDCNVCSIKSIHVSGIVPNEIRQLINKELEAKKNKSIVSYTIYEKWFDG